MRAQRRGRKIAVTPDEIDAFLSSQQVCRVATIGAQDRPHVAPLNSLIRPVIVRKPPSSNCPLSPVRSQPSWGQRLRCLVEQVVVAVHHARTLNLHFTVVGDTH